MPYTLTDIGANLTHDSFDADRADVLQRAADAGVARMIITGSSNQGNIDAAALAAANPGRLFATAGVHPHHASDYDATSDALVRDLTQTDAVVAVSVIQPPVIRFLGFR